MLSFPTLVTTTPGVEFSCSGNGFNRENVVEPSKDMQNIVKNFKQDVEEVLETEQRRRAVEEEGMRCDIFGNDDLRMMYPELQEAGKKMLCSVVTHLEKHGVLSILEKKTGSDYGVFCEFK